MMLVTVDSARDHLRIDYDDCDDFDLELKIKAASQAVVRYLKGGADSFLDTNGDVLLNSNDDPDVPEDVQHATLLLVSHFHRYRDGGNDGGNSGNYLPPAVTALLYPLRDPTIV